MQTIRRIYLALIIVWGTFLLVSQPVSTQDKSTSESISRANPGTKIDSNHLSQFQLKKLPLRINRSVMYDDTRADHYKALEVGVIEQFVSSGILSPDLVDSRTVQHCKFFAAAKFEALNNLIGLLILKSCGAGGVSDQYYLVVLNDGLAPVSGLPVSHLFVEYVYGYITECEITAEGKLLLVEYELDFNEQTGNIESKRHMSEECYEIVRGGKIGHCGDARYR